MDWGVETFATLALSDGTMQHIDNPRHTRRSLVKLRHAQQFLSRKRRGSKNCEKARRLVAALYRKTANQRRDFLHQTSAWLVALIAYGRVTLVVNKPGEERFYWLCRETTIAAPRLIRAWSRRSWIEHAFRTLKQLLATEACQVQTENAYSGHLVLRLLAGLVLLYTARVCLQGRVDDGRDGV